jgi:hypothetical protein
MDLANITIPSSVTNVETYAFYECFSLTNAIIGGAVTSIGDAAFEYCPGLTSIMIPGSVTSIGTYAFGYCSNLASVTFSDGLVNMESYAFQSCMQLTSLTVPGSVTNIGDFAFQTCTGLTSVYFKGDAPAVSSPFFGDTNVIIYSLPGTTGWDEFTTNSGLTAVLWNPTIEVGGSSFDRQNNRFGFNITGTANIPVVLEASTNLASPTWAALQSMTLMNGSVYFSDSFPSNSSSRFYRIRSP